MILHDVADPLIEIAKLFLYHKMQRMADIFFIIFSAVFAYTRDYIFTKRSVLFLLQNKDQTNYVKKDFFVVLLCFLQILQYIWTVLILKMLVCAVINKKAPEDIREIDK